MNVVGIVQARTGSTRLPGKIFLKLCDKPMLWHVIDRLRQSRRITKIVVATTTLDNDSHVEDFCRENKCDVYRGSESDVLDRYYKSASAFNANIVVRITSDCPLIDPRVVDRVIGDFADNARSSCGSCNVIRRTFPRGLDAEVFGFESIRKAWEKAKKLDEREHVTKYIYDHPDLFHVRNVEHTSDLSSLRWTVDERDDFVFVENIYRRLYAEGKLFHMEDVLNVLDKEPQLSAINRQVKQKVI